MTTFDQIRAAMVAKTATTTATVTSAAATATNKVVETTKSVTATIGGILPVTQNQHNRELEAVLRVVEQTGLEVDALYAQLGMTKPAVNPDLISQLAAARMESIKALTKKVETPVVEAPTPQLQLTTPVESQPATVAPSAPSEPVKPVADSYKSVDPMSAGIPLGQPTNWHLA